MVRSRASASSPTAVSIDFIYSFAWERGDFIEIKLPGFDSVDGDVAEGSMHLGGDDRGKFDADKCSWAKGGRAGQKKKGGGQGGGQKKKGGR